MQLGQAAAAVDAGDALHHAAQRTAAAPNQLLSPANAGRERAQAGGCSSRAGGRAAAAGARSRRAGTRPSASPGRRCSGTRPCTPCTSGTGPSPRATQRSASGGRAVREPSHRSRSPASGSCLLTCHGEPQRVRPRPRRVALVPRRAVARAHRPALRLAAHARPRCTSRRSGRTRPASSSRTPSAGRAATRPGGDAQVLLHRRGVDDLAGVEHVLRVEAALHLPERLVHRPGRTSCGSTRSAPARRRARRSG